MKISEGLDIPLDKYLGTDSALTRILKNFKYRSGQLNMARAILSCLNEDDTFLIIEAGTGIGKSFAYLLPAFLFSLDNETKVVISTKTLHLQQQLLKKDIPVLKEAFGELSAIDVSVLRGRRNYVCKRRYLLYEKGRRRKPGLFEDEDFNAAALSNWFAQTKSGFRGDFKKKIPGNVWTHFGGDRHNCLASACHHFSECFFFNSRREAGRADVIIVNHALLLADSRLEMEQKQESKVIPPFSKLVIDEAHHFEATAEAAFTFQLNKAGLKDIMEPVIRTGTTSLRGLLNNIFDRSIDAGTENFNLSTFVRRIDVEIMPGIQEQILN
ncbi:ATP-dependent DNA helicase, partial [Candidatus Riflebacteria bacterium]